MTTTMTMTPARKAFNAKIKRLVRSRATNGKTISANDFLDIDSKVIGTFLRDAIRDFGLRPQGRVKSERPGRKGAYIPAYIVG